MDPRPKLIEVAERLRQIRGGEAILAADVLGAAEALRTAWQDAPEESVIAAAIAELWPTLELGAGGSFVVESNQ